MLAVETIPSMGGYPKMLGVFGKIRRDEMDDN